MSCQPVEKGAGLLLAPPDPGVPGLFFKECCEVNAGFEICSISPGQHMSDSVPQLSSFHIFGGLSKDAATTVWHSVVQKRFNAGDQILSEGDAVQALWIILEGECTVSRSCGNGGSQELARLKAGDVFGEMSFMCTAPHSASIVAETEVFTCAWLRDDFLKLSAENPHAGFQIAANIASVLAERIRRMDTWICELMDQPDTQQHRDEWESFRSAVYTNWQL